MKKSTISLSLLLLAGASCLTACNKSPVKNLTSDGKSVLFTIGENKFYADDLLSNSNFDFINSDEGSRLLYNEIEKAMIKEEIEVDANIQNSVDIKMDEWKEQVKQFAKDNGLTDRLAEQQMLAEKGFETRDELKESYIYEEQRSQYIKKYQVDHMEPKVVNGKIDLENDKSLLKEYVSNTNPMVMKHILVKIESKDNVFNKAQITEAESDRLGTVVKRLAMGSKDTNDMNSFTNIAMDLSEDGSASKGGNLGIVDEYTSFVDEFKYGVYSSLAYNAKHSINTTTNFDDVVEKLDLNKEMFDPNGIYGTIGEIEVLDAFEYLVNQKEEEVYDKEEKKEDFNAYPRNKEFNKEFNNKSAQYLKITDKAATAEKLGCQVTDLYIDKNGYVIDENGNPIVVVRSEFGIHFISVTYNSLEHSLEDNVKYFMTDSKLEGKENSYYLDPKYNIGYKNESVHTTEKNRKKEIEDRVLNYIKCGFASSVTPSEEILNYYIFMSNLENGLVKIPDDELGNVTKHAVTKFVNNKINSTQNKVKNAHKNVIEDYNKKIEADLAAYNDVYANKEGK